MYTYRATLDRVIDGDTVDLDVDLGFFVTVRVRVRLLGVNAPEKFGPEREAGQRAIRFVTEWLSRVDTLIVQTAKTENHGIWLAVLVNDETGERLNDDVLDYLY